LLAGDASAWVGDTLALFTAFTLWTEDPGTGGDTGTSAADFALLAGDAGAWVSGTSAVDTDFALFASGGAVTGGCDACTADADSCPRAVFVECTFWRCHTLTELAHLLWVRAGDASTGIICTSLEVCATDATVLTSGCLVALFIYTSAVDAGFSGSALDACTGIFATCSVDTLFT
jgi:hypothetical protein